MNTSHINGGISLVLAAVIAMATGVGVAHGADAQETLTFTFKLDRTELAQHDGAASVYLDLEREARKACQLPGVGTATLNAVDTDCMAELIDAVVSRVGSAPLAAHHARERHDVQAGRAEPEDTARAALR